MIPHAAALAGMVIVLVTLIDAFEIVLLPRPVPQGAIEQLLFCVDLVHLGEVRFTVVRRTAP